jgi:CelD/BcsL family acetyltransferase involved in cellulose biosynthesis
MVELPAPASPALEERLRTARAALAQRGRIRFDDRVNEETFAHVLRLDRELEDRDFHTDVVRECGATRLHVLMLDDQPVAATYGFYNGDVTCTYRVATHPAFDDARHLVLERAMEWGMREGATKFDFLRGRDPFKYEWGAHDRFSRRRLIRR